MLQLAIWILIGTPGWADHIHEFTATLNGVSASAVPPLAAMLGVLGLIGVFTTGLLLDLLGSSCFRMIETMVFVRHAHQHIHWFQGFADLNRAYIQEDSSLLLNYPPYKSQFLASLKAFKVWNKRDREAYLLLLRGAEFVKNFETPAGIFY